MNRSLIIIVCAFIPPSHAGAGKRMYNYYKYLKEKEENVLLITHTTNRDDKNIFTIHSKRFKTKLRKLSFFYVFIKTLIILFFKKFGKENKKVVWLTGSNPLTFATSIILKNKGFKIITQNTLPGSDDPIFKYPGDIMGIKYGLKQYQYNKSDAVVSISPRLYNLSIKKHDNVFLIPNPVDINKFSSNLTLEEKFGSKRILSVGMLGKRKGTDILLKTILLLNKTHPEIEYTIVGPDQGLKELCTAKNIDYEEIINIKNIKFINYVEDPSDLFKTTSLFFLPSREEGFGTVFIEAMAANVPVVAKEIKGVTDYIFKNNYEGIIDSDDEIKYANYIKRCFSNIDTYKSIYQENNTTISKFNKINIYNQYDALIKEVINK
ncbi:MAG: glycosyltransferase [Brumimicrobium sp.]